MLVILGGWLSDSLWRKTNSLRVSRSYLIATCQFLSALSFIPILISHCLVVAVIAISLGLGFSMMPNAAFYALNTDLAKEHAGLSAGVMLFFAALGGLVSPALIGLLEQITGSFHAGFFFIIVLTLSSVLGIVLFQHPDTQKEF